MEKYKFCSSRPATKLFLFSNKLNDHIGSYFSGNLIFEFELSNYDYKGQEEAKLVVDYLNVYCNSRAINPYKFMTVVLNYKATGLTMASLCGDYDYPIAVHGSTGYRELAVVHEGYETLLRRLFAFEHYSRSSLSYAEIAKSEPIKLTERQVVSLKNHLKKTEQSIRKSISTVLATFHKKFHPSYHK